MVLAAIAPNAVGAQEQFHDNEIIDQATPVRTSPDSYVSAALVAQFHNPATTSAPKANPTTSTNVAYAGTALTLPGATATIQKPKPVPPPAPKKVIVAQTPKKPAAKPVNKPAAKKPAAKPAVAASTSTAKPTGISWGGKYKAGIHFPEGYCTAYVARKRGGWRTLGNAGEWLGNAKAAGVPTGSTPIVGAIMVTNESGWGHVAYVESVDEANKKFTVSEMNYQGFGITSRRTLPYNFSRIKGFIY